MKKLKDYFYVAGIMTDGTGKTTFLSDSGTKHLKIDLSTDSSNVAVILDFSFNPSNSPYDRGWAAGFAQLVDKDSKVSILHDKFFIIHFSLGHENDCGYQNTKILEVSGAIPSAKYFNFFGMMEAEGQEGSNTKWRYRVLISTSDNPDDRSIKTGTSLRLLFLAAE
jgi:hypothetical protein